MKVKSRDESLNTTGECEGSSDLLTGECTKHHTRMTRATTTKTNYLYFCQFSDKVCWHYARQTLTDILVVLFRFSLFKNTFTAWFPMYRIRQIPQKTVNVTVVVRMTHFNERHRSLIILRFTVLMLKGCFCIIHAALIQIWFRLA